MPKAMNIVFSRPIMSETQPKNGRVRPLSTRSIVAANVTGFADPDVIADYASPVTALLSAFVFCLFRKIDRAASRPVWTLDRLCFGVYLIHPLLIHLLYRALGIVPAGALYPLRTLAVTGLVAAAAYALSWVLMKVPPLKKYVL